jgi:hypothetical protein
MSKPVVEDLDDREVPLCPGCLAPIAPHDPFCEMCGQPLTSAATTLPMERIRSLGEITRRAAERPKTIALIGIWLIFGPPVLILVIMAIAFPTPVPQTLEQLPQAIFSLAFTLGPILLLGGILLRTTARYLTVPRDVARDDTEDDEAETAPAGSPPNDTPSP